jgi:hypothetical protein
MNDRFDGYPLASRARSEVRVLIIARISTVHQDPRSLDDQVALCEKYVRDRYDGPARFDHIKGQGSGKFLDRQELAEAEAAIESKRYDMVVVSKTSAASAAGTARSTSANLPRTPTRGSSPSTTRSTPPARTGG